MKNASALLRRALFVGAMIVLSAAPSAAETFTYMSGLFGGFNRPNEGSPPTTLSSFATNVPYNQQGFTVTLDGVYSFTLSADFDYFLILYRDSFDPMSPLVNALVADDNGGGGFNPGFNYPLVADTTYIVVPTAFSSNTGTIGVFAGTISGPGEISPVGGLIVPEPTTLLLLGTGLAGVAVRVRKRRRGRES